jgi:diphosphomevalonate decarboxylase
VLTRDFELLAGVVELDSDMMHAVMMTSSPALHYWMPGSLDVMNAVRAWRHEGLAVCYTVDAGPNVHVLCPETDLGQVQKRLAELSSVKKVLVARAGGPARLIEETRIKRR